MVRAKTPRVISSARGGGWDAARRHTIGGQKVELDALAGRCPWRFELAGRVRPSAAIGHAVRFTGLPLDDVAEMASGRPRLPGIPAVAEWDPAASELRVCA
jgi:hypothetical protein